MKFTTGDKVIVKSSRKGTYKGLVTKDFDTNIDEWYSISLRQPVLEGLSNVWYEGESVPCRKGLAIVEIDYES